MKIGVAMNSSIQAVRKMSLADAIAITDEPRIVTSAEHPFLIVHTNRA